jgi:hypothetical protein
MDSLASKLEVPTAMNSAHQDKLRGPTTLWTLFDRYARADDS